MLNIKATIGNGQPADMKDMLEGRIDVLWQGAPPPIPSLSEVLARAPATVFDLTADEQDNLGRTPFSPLANHALAYSTLVPDSRMIFAYLAISDLRTAANCS